MRKKISIPIVLVVSAFAFTMLNCCAIGKCVKGTCNSGNGTYQYNNGNLYIGEWNYFMMNGRGTFYFNSGKWEGSRYEGEWKNNRITGVGIFYFANGDIYEGEWNAGDRDKYLVSVTASDIWDNERGVEAGELKHKDEGIPGFELVALLISFLVMLGALTVTRQLKKP